MIIFDLDGTLADCEHRRHFVDPDNYKSLCEYSNYRTKDSDGNPCEAYIDLEGRASWRYKSTGEPFKHGFQSFYEACDKDEPIQETLSVLSKLIWDKDIQIWSARCESQREKTIEWFLDNWFINLFSYQKQQLNELIKMRPIGDNTPDEQLKEKWLDEAISQGKVIDSVFDSDPASIRMWRRRGVFVFNCCQHDGEF